MTVMNNEDPADPSVHEPPLYRAPWPHEATDRLHALLGELQTKEMERMRLVECLRLIVMTETAINLSKQRRDLNAAARARLVNAAIVEKNKAVERSSVLLRALNA